MKTSKILSLALGLVAMFCITACVQDDDYSVPTVILQEPNITETNTIAQVKAMYTGSLVNFSEVSNEGKVIISGYVVSSDEAGNFYKTLIIQDAPENPSAAIQIDIDATSLFAQYKPGQKVYVILSDSELGLNLGMDDVNGVLHIGAIESNAVERISGADYENYLVRSTVVETIVPKVITPAEFDDSYINMLVQIDDMQLRSAELGQAYGNLDDTYTVNRYIKNCVDDSETILRNSGFADFKSQMFPQGRGSLVAVFSKYNSDYQLFIRDTADVMFDSERCDPVFEELFNDSTDNTTLDTNGWINFAEAGTELWSEQVYSGNGYAEFSAYGTTESSNIGWLISPGIDLDAQDGEILSFQTEHAYPDAGHDAIEVLISTDFSGNEADITSATWTSLEFTSSLEADFDTWFNFTNSGNIDISSYTGTAYIAFRYTGSDTADLNTTIHVDNVRVFVP
ncbi:DUF5689 domain-containing protein [Corallibacter vietnamensis]|uniref:DUF5689 domain-containing protein n=1 Tax=Corallibacter vietnamensis TaxID=904130 RepID=A0ABP7GUY9_9FLAO